MRVLIRFFVAVLALSTFLTGCSNTKLRDVWQAESFHHEDFTEVLVIGVTENVTNRLIFESEFSRELERRGIKVIQSNTVMGNSKPTKEKVIAYCKENPVKYVLATRLVDIELSKNYVQPTATVYSSGGYYYPSYYGGWGGVSTIVTTEGYMDTNETIVLETTIYDGRDAKLVWAAKSASFEETTVSYVADDLAKLMVENIKK